MNRTTSAPKIAHYYGRLNVATDAPPEVIRAAYKALVQKYHPDRHQGSLRHELLVTALNKAQEVLLDPARRAAHDQWIRQGEIRRGLREPSDANALGFGLRLRLFWTSISIDGLPFAVAWRMHLTAVQRVGFGLVACVVLAALVMTTAVLLRNDDAPHRVAPTLQSSSAR